MKVRFDGLDVMAMVAHLQGNALLLGRRVVNIYEQNDGGESGGGSSSGGGGDTYIFKFDGGTSSSSVAADGSTTAANSSSKVFLTMQSGIRFHDTPHYAAEASVMPTPFCSKLRKHLRGLRLQKISQIGLDRVVIFTFLGGGGGGGGGASSGGSSGKCFLILELYAKGNLILTDQDYRILALLRSHSYQDKKKSSTTTATATESTTTSDKPGGEEDKQDATTSSSSNNNNTVAVQVGQIYPVTYAATVDVNPDQSENESDSKFQEWVTEQLEQQQQQQQAALLQSSSQQAAANGGGGKKKKKSASSSSLTLKTLLLRPASGFSKYGPALLEHCILMAGLAPHQAIVVGGMSTNSGSNDGKEEVVSLTDEQWKHLESTLRTEAPRILKQLQQTTSASESSSSSSSNHVGYLLYQPRKDIEKDKDTDNASSDPTKKKTPEPSDEHLPHADKILQEFQPILLKQHESRTYVQCRDFGQAVSQFFAQLQGQKSMLKAQAAEQAARQKLEKVRNDQATRVATLEQEQVRLQQCAALVQARATQVDQALVVINSALDSGMDWDQLEQLVQVEKEQNQNPIAQLIQELQLDQDAMILRLPLNEYDDDEKDSYLDVQIMLQETAHANASRLFAKYRASKEKSQKTIEASSMALKAAEESAQRQLLEAQKKKGGGGLGGGGGAGMGRRRLAWYEKFHWFITSENYLVLAGKDAHQNEMLVKRYLRPGDAYLHADVHGAASCILRAKRRRAGKSKSGGTASTGKTMPVPLSEQALREAGNFTICHSSAWASRMVTSAWWVESHQVSKTAPSGEYLTVGSFMVRGKKNFLPPSHLELGLAVLFRLGDNESILRHANERRDFALSQLEEQEQSDEADVTASHAAKKGEGTKNAKDNIKDGEPSSTTQSLGENPAVELSEVEISGKGEGVIDDKASADEPPAEMEGRPSTNDEKDSGAEENAITDSASTNDNYVEATGATNENDVSKPENKKRGYSVRERKLIKKYGSLEEAEKALSARTEVSNREPPPPAVPRASTNSPAQSANSNSMKRGKKSKMKRAKKKYSDQDDDDRELALLLLQGGEKKKNDTDESKRADSSQAQQAAAAETTAILVKDSSKVSERLSDDVREVLAQCVQVGGNGKGDENGDQQGEEPVIRWDKLDADILEQLIALEPVEAQVAAATRLLTLRNTTRVDNFSASLAGILRTIRKYGYESLNKKNESAEAPDKAKRKGEAEKEAESSQWKEIMAQEGIMEGDLDEDAVDDTLDLSKLTGKPLPEDLLLYAVPVLAPYQTISQYRFRVKLTPGNMKRGKAAKQCVEMLLKGDKTPGNGEQFKGLIKKVVDNDWIQTICSDVKISAPGASKMNKKQKGKSGKKK